MTTVRNYCSSFVFSTLASMALLIGCGDGDIGDAGTGPHVVGFDQESIKVGQTLNFYGHNFMHPDSGHTVVEFEGVYYARMEDGSESPQWSKFSIHPTYDGSFPEGGTINGRELTAGAQILRWNRFGPFGMPFHEIDRPGRYEGIVRAVNIKSDGTREEDTEPRTLNLLVQPSILIRVLEPVVDVVDNKIVTPNCGAPALRAFSNMPYLIEVEAMGFEPVSFNYDISNANEQVWQSYAHRAQGQVDRLGDPTWYQDEMVVFDELPENSDHGISTITVTATDQNNNKFFTALPISIVRPLQFFYDGKRRLAEYYEPIAVHGPIVGAIGTTVSYSENHSESRQQGVSVNISHSFSEAHGISNSASWTDGISVTDTTSTSTTDGTSQSENETTGENYNTSYNHTEGTNAGVSTTDGTNWSWNSSSTDTSSDYVDKVNSVYSTNNTDLSAGVDLDIPFLKDVGGVSGFGFTPSIGVDHTYSSGETNGTTTGHREGRAESSGEAYAESTSSSESWGSTTSDSQSESFGGNYAVSNQSSISNTTSESQASSESVTYSSSTTEGSNTNYTTGDSEAWNESWVTTESDSSLLSYSSRVPRGRCAVVYRQTVRFVRTAELYAHDLCGLRSRVAELNFNEWSWSPNIAIGDDCTSSLPQSTQPKAQCFHACQ